MTTEDQTSKPSAQTATDSKPGENATGEAPKKKAAAQKKRAPREKHYFKGKLHYRSRTPEPTPFHIRFPGGAWTCQHMVDLHLEYSIKPDDKERFERHHFFVNQRIVRKDMTND